MQWRTQNFLLRGSAKYVSTRENRININDSDTKLTYVYVFKVVYLSLFHKLIKQISGRHWNIERSSLSVLRLFEAFKNKTEGCIDTFVLGGAALRTSQENRDQFTAYFTCGSEMSVRAWLCARLQIYCDPEMLRYILHLSNQANKENVRGSFVNNWNKNVNIGIKKLGIAVIQV